jgi:hypothetical protein
MALQVVDDQSKVTSDATATVVIESDLKDFMRAQSELSLSSWEVAREWAHENGISGPGLGNTKLAPFAVNHLGEEIGTEHYNMPPQAPARQPAAYRVEIQVRGRML